MLFISVRFLYISICCISVSSVFVCDITLVQCTPNVCTIKVYHAFGITKDKIGIYKLSKTLTDMKTPDRYTNMTGNKKTFRY